MPFTKVVEAFQYDGTNAQAIVDWMTNFYTTYAANTGPFTINGYDVDGSVLTIHTMQGLGGWDMTVNETDWVFREDWGIGVQTNEFFTLQYRSIP
jgi:hypothetical protein